ncbi:unnamed protein product [Sphagnum balticum]
MEYRERTSAMFAYLTHENSALKEEVTELKRLLNGESSQTVESELQGSNSRLREQMLTMEAEVAMNRYEDAHLPADL